MKKKGIRFGIIGPGFMGREFAGAVARWGHIQETLPRPVIAGVSGRGNTDQSWFLEHFPDIEISTTDYRDLLATGRIDAIYCAVPHQSHEQIYIDIIKSGKHLLGEKPFGMNLEANLRILDEIQRNPAVFVRCSSEFPFTPAAQRLGAMIEAEQFGEIIEVESGYLHSSDLNPKKPINWKRMREYNGEYGCMGDLGMHACHMPFRAGWIPRNVRAILSNIITERPGPSGELVPCDTWDNATLFCEATQIGRGRGFPLTIKTQRIAPGEKNSWYLSVLGTKASARLTTKNINQINVLHYDGGEQAWQQIDLGGETTFKSITAPIFELGFSDLILQMLAAFVSELTNGKPPTKFAACATPEETTLSHRLFTAALHSHRRKTVVEL